MLALHNTKGFALALLALGAFAISAPFAFAEENTTTDYEAEAGEIIEFVTEALAEEEEEATDDDMYEDDDEDAKDEDEDDDREDGRDDDEDEDDDKRTTVRAEVRELLAEARALWNDGEYKEAREVAKEARALLNEEKKEVKEYVRDKCEAGDDCKKIVKKQAVACKVDMLKDGERDRKFCRDGEWKEKREAKLDDIMSGFVAAADLTDEQAEQVRAEVQALVRQLIALILANR